MKTLIALLAFIMLTACAQAPTRNTQVVDDRPGLAFELSTIAAEYYWLRVDGISYGRVGQYQAGENLLKLIDGTHQVELLSDDTVVFAKEVYLGTDSNRILKVGEYE